MSSISNCLSSLCVFYLFMFYVLFCPVGLQQSTTNGTNKTPMCLRFFSVTNVFGFQKYRSEIVGGTVRFQSNQYMLSKTRQGKACMDSFILARFFEGVC